MSSPLVSIIIPVYNSENKLGTTIESALKQSWPNKEIIIVDDGSADGSLSVARQYESEQVKVISQKNGGASTARNRGLKEAKGNYIQFLDADDLLSENKIAGQVAVLEENPGIIAVCSTVHFFDGDDHLQRKPSAYEESFLIDSEPVRFLLNLYGGYSEKGSMIQPNAWLTPRAVIDKAGPWNEFKCPDDDGEFFCRVVLASNGVKRTKGLNYYRKYKNQGSLSGARSLEAVKNILLSIDLKYGYLKAKSDDPVVDKTFARLYWEFGVSIFPKYKALSDEAIEKATKLGYKGVKYKAGPLSTRLSKLLGWRMVRRLTYLRYKA